MKVASENHGFANNQFAFEQLIDHVVHDFLKLFYSDAIPETRQLRGMIGFLFSFNVADFSRNQDRSIIVDIILCRLESA